MILNAWLADVRPIELGTAFVFKAYFRGFDLNTKEIVYFLSTIKSPRIYL